jgi:hypothetical protein
LIGGKDFSRLKVHCYVLVTCSVIEMIQVQYSEAMKTSEICDRNELKSDIHLKAGRLSANFANNAICLFNPLCG